MSTANTSGCAAGAIQNRYNLDTVDFGKKFISEIMDASGKGEAWATKIMDADRLPVTVGYLNPQARTNNNLYGALLTTVDVQVPQASKDETVKKTFQTWAKHLKEDFPAMSAYTPKSLGERAANLLATAKGLRKNLEKLCATGEIAQRDTQQWGHIIGALEKYGQAAEKLHAAVCAGPDIASVQLDIQARRH